MDFSKEFKDTPAEESGGFSLIDTGTYEAEIVDCKLDITKEPARLTFVYQITGDPNYAGRKLFGNYQMAGRGIGFLKKDLTTLGLNFAEVGSPEDIASLVWDAMPLQVVIYVAQKEWQGKMYNNTYLNELLDAPAATAPTPLNQKEQNRLDAKAASPGTVMGKVAPQATQAPKQAPKPAAKAPAKPPPKKSPADFGPEPAFGADEDAVPW